MNKCIYESPEVQEVLLEGNLLLLNGSTVYPSNIGEDFTQMEEFEM